jgi:hypothetical protein
MMVASCAEQGTPSASRVNRDQPFLRVPRDARSHRRHRVAAQTENHRQHSLSVEAHRAKQPIAEDREPRNVSAVFQKTKHQKERRDNGQHNGHRIGQAHGDEAVLADEKVTYQWRRDVAGNECRGWIDESVEHLLFERPDQRLRAEHADEQIGGIQDEGKNWQARSRVLEQHD